MLKWFWPWTTILFEKIRKFCNTLCFPRKQRMGGLRQATEEFAKQSRENAWFFGWLASGSLTLAVFTAIMIIRNDPIQAMWTLRVFVLMFVVTALVTLYHRNQSLILVSNLSDLTCDLEPYPTLQVVRNDAPTVILGGTGAATRGTAPSPKLETLISGRNRGLAPTVDDIVAVYSNITNRGKRDLTDGERTAINGWIRAAYAS